MSAPVIPGIVKNGVVVPASPLPEGAAVQIHLCAADSEIPPDLRAELDAWGQARAKALELTDVADDALPPSEKIGLDESEWRDDAKALAKWDAWLDAIEPLEFTDEERESMQRYREEFRRFNLEAVRKQMGLEQAS